MATSSGISFSNTEGKTFLLSKKDVHTLEKQSGFKIIRKIEEGATNIALLAKSNSDGKNYILLVSKNNEDTSLRGATLIAEMQSNHELNNSVVQIYDIFTIKKFKLQGREVVVQLEEYIDGITLDEKIFRMSKEKIDIKVIFLLRLRAKVKELLEYIKSKGIWYGDLQATNFMLRDSNDIDTLTFIDVESFSTRIEGMENMEMSSEELDAEINRNFS
jgi:serine/threonine protein kinase